MSPSWISYMAWTVGITYGDLAAEQNTALSTH